MEALAQLTARVLELRPAAEVRGRGRGKDALSVSQNRVQVH
jgi:hypothetical protein